MAFIDVEVGGFVFLRIHLSVAMTIQCEGPKEGVSVTVDILESRGAKV